MPVYDLTSPPHSRFYFCARADPAGPAGGMMMGPDFNQHPMMMMAPAPMMAGLPSYNGPAFGSTPVFVQPLKRRWPALIAPVA